MLPAFGRSGTMRVSPSETRETTLRERIKNCSGSWIKSQSPRFGFLTFATHRKRILVISKLEITADLRPKQSSLRGGIGLVIASRGSLRTTKAGADQALGSCYNVAH